MDGINNIAGRTFKKLDLDGNGNLDKNEIAKAKESNSIYSKILAEGMTEEQFGDALEASINPHKTAVQKNQVQKAMLKELECLQNKYNQLSEKIDSENFVPKDFMKLVSKDKSNLEEIYNMVVNDVMVMQKLVNDIDAVKELESDGIKEQVPKFGLG